MTSTSRKRRRTSERKNFQHLPVVATLREWQISSPLGWRLHGFTDPYRALESEESLHKHVIDPDVTAVRNEVRVVTVVSGRLGAGKTTLLKFAAKQISASQNRGFLVQFVEARDFFDGKSLKKWSELVEDTNRKRPERVFLFVDGLDELRLTPDAFRDLFTVRIPEFLSSAHCALDDASAHIVFSFRKGVYPDMDSWLCGGKHGRQTCELISRPSYGGWKIRHLQLEDLQEWQILFQIEHCRPKAESAELGFHMRRIFEAHPGVLAATPVPGEVQIWDLATVKFFADKFPEHGESAFFVRSIDRKLAEATETLFSDAKAEWKIVTSGLEAIAKETFLHGHQSFSIADYESPKGLHGDLPVLQVKPELRTRVLDVLHKIGICKVASTPDTVSFANDLAQKLFLARHLARPAEHMAPNKDFRSMILDYGTRRMLRAEIDRTAPSWNQNGDDLWDNWTALSHDIFDTGTVLNDIKNELLDITINPQRFSSESSADAVREFIRQWEKKGVAGLPLRFIAYSMRSSVEWLSENCFNNSLRADRTAIMDQLLRLRDFLSDSRNVDASDERHELLYESLAFAFVNFTGSAQIASAEMAGISGVLNGHCWKNEELRIRYASHLQLE